MKPSGFDEEETNGLLMGYENGKSKMKSMNIDVAEAYPAVSTKLDTRWLAIVSLLVLAGALVHYYQVPSKRNGTKGIVQYQCPKKVRHAENVDEEEFHKEYVEDQKKLFSNVTAFLDNFRSQGFDAWEHTYEEVKAGMLHWKQTHFPPNLKSGDSIYESACGIGLNLYMTLEILQDAGITNLTVYGNEYMPFSTEKANVVFDHAAPAGSRKGHICTADSTDLSFVPSNAFDLVYTGYISPLLDPVHFETGDGTKNFEKYKQLCTDSKIEANWKDKKIAVLAQEKQEAFYGRWIAEMVRVAKPGSAVIVEQVSYPLCEEFLDWGGVNQKWWAPAVEKYGWDVDPKSFVFEKDTIFHNRYHAFMRKN